MCAEPGGAAGNGTAGSDRSEDFRQEGLDDFDDLEWALYRAGREAGVGAPAFIDEALVRARARAVAAGRSFRPWYPG